MEGEGRENIYVLRNKRPTYITDYYTCIQCALSNTGVQLLFHNRTAITTVELVMSLHSYHVKNCTCNDDVTIVCHHKQNSVTLCTNWGV